MLELKKLKSKIKNELLLVNNEIKTTLEQCNDPTLSNIYIHILNSLGKQIRASIIIIISKIHNKCTEDIIKIAAGIELIHLASLIHDDIIDNASKRRNIETICKKFGINNAILSGVHCYAMALNIIASLNNPNLIKIISKAVIDLCEGESLQVNNRHNYDLTLDDYWKIISLKTSTLFQASAYCSAIYSDLSKENQENYATFGSLIGDIFQLTDDYLDLFDNDNSLNKSIEQDIESGDISLPILLASKDLKSPNKSSIKKQLLKLKPRIASEINAKISEKETKIIDILESIESNSRQNVSELYQITDLIIKRSKQKN